MPSGPGPRLGLSVVDMDSCPPLPDTGEGRVHGSEQQQLGRPQRTPVFSDFCKMASFSALGELHVLSRGAELLKTKRTRPCRLQQHQVMLSQPKAWVAQMSNGATEKPVLLPFFVFFFFKIIYLKGLITEKESHRQRASEIIPAEAHSPEGCNGQAWARSFPQVSHAGAGPALGPLSNAFPGHLASRWDSNLHSTVPAPSSDSKDMDAPTGWLRYFPGRGRGSSGLVTCGLAERRPCGCGGFVCTGQI